MSRAFVGIATAVVVTSSALSNATAQNATREKLGVIIAVGDIMQCNEFEARSMAVADRIRKELAELGQTPVRLLVARRSGISKG